MAAYRLHGEALFDTVAHALAVQSSLQSAWPLVHTEVGPSREDALTALTVDWVHTDADGATRSALLAWLRDNLRDQPLVRTWVSRFWVTWHRYVGTGGLRDYTDAEIHEGIG